MSCATCRRIRSYVANKAAKALRLGQHQPKLKPSAKVYRRAPLSRAEQIEWMRDADKRIETTMQRIGKQEFSGDPDRP